MTSALAQTLALLDVAEVGDSTFTGTQYDSPNHHIVGGAVAAQALMAASKTVPGRLPHSEHMYFLRLGDARHPVRYDVTALRDGRTFSVRRVTASQGSSVLFEALTSFATGLQDSDFQQAMPAAPDPDSLVPLGNDGLGAWPRPFDMRYVDGPWPMPGADVPPRPHVQLWLRADGEVPDDPILSSCLLAYISALTLLEGAMSVMGTTPMGPRQSALLDHVIWFHRAANFADWLLYDQRASSVVAGRGLSTGTIYNRDGRLVCSAMQEGYFPPRPVNLPTGH